VAQPMLHRTTVTSADELATVRLGDILVGLSRALDIPRDRPRVLSERAGLV